ncbi:MAG TPA: ribosome silencing factor [Aggregicoccus sp.]|nr:ribosome silencing factor [Aggregicoccus sp.]
MAMKKKTSPKKKAPASTKAGKAKGKAVAAKKSAAKKAPGKGPAKKQLARKKPAKKKLPAGLVSVPAGPAENPRAQALARQIAQLVLDKKAKDVLILDVRGMTSYADYFVIASGESDRQVSAMADNVLSEMKKAENLRPIGHEGTETGQWVLIDYGEVVVHLFYEEVRAFYDLEGLWADAAREQVA